MPVLHGDMGDRPDWCELERYEITSLPSGGEFTWRASHERNKMVVVDGLCRSGGHSLGRGRSLDVPAGEHVITCDDAATWVLLGGHWGDDCGGAGIFTVARAEEPADIGDPVTYPKHTTFDRHYHDCDEYWILVSGRGTAVSEDVIHEVGPGDCVATRMGHHHDFSEVTEPVSAIFFETTMRGMKRRGHLWEHSHGPAVPIDIGGM